jgi:predicted nucleic acid-binding protein
VAAIVVVSDCSPIRALRHLGLLKLCQTLYGSVIIPQAVQAELLKPTTTCPPIQIIDYPGFEVRAPTSGAAELAVPLDLDAGETQAIVIALELKADLVLMDERKGTKAARGMGLTTIGVFGVLLEAKRAGLIDHVLPCVDRLVTNLNFFASPALRQQLAELAGE